jgi:hypothetical protein
MVRQSDRGLMNCWIGFTEGFLAQRMASPSESYDLPVSSRPVSAVMWHSVKPRRTAAGQAFFGVEQKPFVFQAE